MIEKHEGPDIPPRGEGQNAPHGEAAEIALAGIDDQVDRFGHVVLSMHGLKRSMDEGLRVGKLGE
jgi:hypothetical protein